jgi:hypothetical protein
MLSPLLLAAFSLVGVTPEAHPQQPSAQTHPAWLHELDSHPHQADELLHLAPCSNGLLQAPLPPLVPQAWQAHQEARFRHDPSNFQHLSDKYPQVATSQPLTQPPSGHAIDPAGTRGHKHDPVSLQQDANMVLRATCLARFRPWPRASPR